MTVFFGLVAIVGLAWVVLEQGAKNASPAPSMYYVSGNGWILFIIGVIGAVCSRFFP